MFPTALSVDPDGTTAPQTASPANQRIARVDEDLAGYLARHVRTGSACRFDP